MKKKMIIPLKNDRTIQLNMSPVTGEAWMVIMSDELVTDIQKFFASEYYELDNTKKIEIVDA